MHFRRHEYLFIATILLLASAGCLAVWLMSENRVAHFADRAANALIGWICLFGIISFFVYIAIRLYGVGLTHIQGTWRSLRRIGLLLLLICLPILVVAATTVSVTSVFANSALEARWHREAIMAPRNGVIFVSGYSCLIGFFLMIASYLGYTKNINS